MNSILKLIRIFLALGCISCFGGTVFASNFATQKITLQVNAINELAVSRNPGTLIVRRNQEAVDSSTTYAIMTNTRNKKITVAIDTPMPRGVFLRMSLKPPAGANSAGEAVLSTTAADLVTGINPIATRDLAISYKLLTNSQAEVQTGRRTVVLTLTQ